MRTMRGTERNARGAMVLLLLLAGAGGAGAQAPLCTARETDRWTLQVAEGVHLYVEPTDWVVAGDRTLLAGTPSWTLADSLVERGADPTSNPVAGVMLGPGRRAEAVPWPRHDLPLAVLRTAAIGAGGWRFLFAGMSEPRPRPDDERLTGLFHGEWDGAAWRVFEPVPPAPVTGLQLSTSSIVPMEDGFAWALPYRTRERRGIAVLLRTAAGWTWEVFGDRGAVYVELMRSGGVLYAGVVEPDRSRRSDMNSLFLYRREGEWRRLRRLVLGGESGVYHVRDIGVPVRPVWTWRTFEAPAWKNRVLADVLSEQPRELEIDSSMSYHAGFTTAAGEAMWVTEHVAADDARTLRIVRLRGSSLELLAEVASPFTGHFAARASGTDRIALAGPLFSRDPHTVTLVSLILELQLSCPG